MRPTKQQKAAVIAQYETHPDLHQLAAELGLDTTQVELIGWRAGKRRRKTIPAFWELQQGNKTIHLAFRQVIGSGKSGTPQRAEIKSRIKPGKPYTLAKIIPSKANTETDMKINEAKQEVTNIIAGLDQNTRSSTGAYSDIVKLLDAVASDDGKYEPQFRHTKNDSQCLQKAADDEPIFVLRGQDAMAPNTILHWMALNINNPLVSDIKMAEAFDTVMAMRNYEPRKLPS